MNDGISREEIDKLLSQAGVAKESSDSLNIEDEIIKTFFSRCFETVSSALSVVISKDIVFKGQKIKGVKYSELEKEELGNFVVTEVPFAGNFEGVNLLLLEKPFCSAAADLFLGGERKKERELDDETMDALKEIVNQIFGTLATAYSSGIKELVGFELNAVKMHVDGFEKKDSTNLSNLVQISYNLDVIDFYKGKFTYLLSWNVVKKFFEKLKKQKEKDEVKTRKRRIEDVESDLI
ncbi:chemotaxis protein CheX, partial [bacterium]|nr:chemotaxis protein CheX [bacterium]